MSVENPKTDLLLRLATFVAALVALVLAQQMVSKGLNILQNAQYVSYPAVVEQIEKIEKNGPGPGQTPQNGATPLGGLGTEGETIFFRARILLGRYQGDTVSATQLLDPMLGKNLIPIKAGEKVLVMRYPSPDGTLQWIFAEHLRTDVLLALGLSFFALLLLFGRLKGVYTLVSLVMTVAAIFLVFVPAVLNGYNIYLMTALTCIYSIITTLVMIGGASRKTLATILGCSFGVVVSALIAFFVGKLLYLTGYVDEHSYYLQNLNPDRPIDLRAVIFCCILIGALGAVMDVAMDIASSLHEVKQHNPGADFRTLYRSGISIGRDIVGTMVNTLVLAYVGGSLASMLLLVTYASSLRQMMNTEHVAVELLQALAGSIAILLTIPLTAAVCGVLYPKAENAVAAADAEALTPLSMEPAPISPEKKPKEKEGEKKIYRR